MDYQGLGRAYEGMFRLAMFGAGVIVAVYATLSATVAGAVIYGTYRLIRWYFG